MTAGCKSWRGPNSLGHSAYDLQSWGARVPRVPWGGFAHGNLSAGSRTYAPVSICPHTLSAGLSLRVIVFLSWPIFSHGNARRPPVQGPLVRTMQTLKVLRAYTLQSFLQPAGRDVLNNHIINKNVNVNVAHTRLPSAGFRS